MLEIIVFAVTLVFAQLLGGLIVMGISMKWFMSKKFIKKYTKMALEVGEEIQDEMEDDF